MNATTGYPENIGALFKNSRRKKQRSPLLTGTIELNRSLVRHLYSLAEDGEPAKLSLAAWKNVSKSGVPYYTLKAQGEYKPRESVLPFERDDEFDL